MAATIDDTEATASRRPPRRGRTLTVLGVVLLLAGLSCLGWVAYQYVGSNVVSRHAFEVEKSGLRAQWRQAAPSGSDPRGTDRAHPAQPAPVPGDAIALLRVPRFGVDFEVPILQGTDQRTLARGVGHYPGTADPGQVGNFAIAGHRVTHGQPFARLLELTAGDQVVVETQAAVYTYVLDTAPRDLTVTDSASWVLDPVPGRPQQAPTRALITLTTCQDLFHSPDRSVGFGHLESTRNKT